MYKEEVKILPLKVFKVELRHIEDPEKEISSEVLVEDYGILLNPPFPWNPDYVIKGWFSKINHGSKNLFIIDQTGPHSMYITGKTSFEDIQKYKLSNTKYIESWRDSKISYLLQIL